MNKQSAKPAKYSLQGVAGCIEGIDKQVRVPIPNKIVYWGECNVGAYDKKGLCEFLMRFSWVQPGDDIYIKEPWRVGAWDMDSQRIAFDYKVDGACGPLVYVRNFDRFATLVCGARAEAKEAGYVLSAGEEPIWKKGEAPTKFRLLFQRGVF